MTTKKGKLKHGQMKQNENKGAKNILIVKLKQLKTLMAAKTYKID